MSILFVLLSLILKSRMFSSCRLLVNVRVTLCYTASYAVYNLCLLRLPASVVGRELSARLVNRVVAELVRYNPVV